MYDLLDSAAKWRILTHLAALGQHGTQPEKEKQTRTNKNIKSIEP